MRHGFFARFVLEYRVLVRMAAWWLYFDDDPAAGATLYESPVGRAVEY